MLVLVKLRILKSWALPYRGGYQDIALIAESDDERLSGMGLSVSCKEGKAASFGAPAGVTSLP